jgi:hypothetical protein
VTARTVTRPPVSTVTLLEAELGFEQRVLHRLGGVAGDVGHVPAVPQQVAAQQVPADQQDIRHIGVLGMRTRKPQTGQEKEYPGECVPRAGSFSPLI